MPAKKAPRRSAGSYKARKASVYPPDCPPRVIVKFKQHIAPDYRDDALDDEEWRRLVEQFPGLRLQRLFTSVAPERIQELQELAQRNNQEQQRQEPQQPDFLTYFALVGMPLDAAPAVAAQVAQWESVESAYVDPHCVGPCGPSGYVSALLAGHTASGSRGYLEAVNAPFAWRFPGGAGEGQHLVDLEMGWQFCHRDLQAHFRADASPLLGGINKVGYRDHGTKVLGVICGHPPQSVVSSGAPCCIGITPNLASVKVISYATGAAAAAEVCVGAPPASGPLTRNDALMQAISHLQALGGGVLLLEAEVGGMEAGVWGAWARSDHPLEIIPTDFAQIQLARNLGIVVIEAAGNAGADLDQYEDARGRHTLRMRIPDPANPGRTIPNPDFQDSGAIMVGAAKQNLQRRSSSNYGSRVNCCAWGEGVFSTNLSGTYTATFNGTSSASALIAGVTLAVLGLIANNGLPARTPQQIREILSDRAFGRLATPSSRPIGSMPDLAKIARDALGLS